MATAQCNRQLDSEGGSSAKIGTYRGKAHPYVNAKLAQHILRMWWAEKTGS